ncbi:hypothetical protein BHE74_00046528 [Ensete ventricosum]|nr:hypothetical protein BHE74_00046528 [Ensete ventricosum]RZS18845.1 hypothetical protein BHM03_00051166 [Ensete ventricosum]
MAGAERLCNDRAEGMKRNGRRQEQVRQWLGSSERWRRLVRYQEGEQSSNNAAGAGGERTGHRQLRRCFGAIAATGGEEELDGGRCNIGDRRRGAAITLATTRAAARAREDAATTEAPTGGRKRDWVSKRSSSCCGNNDCYGTTRVALESQGSKGKDNSDRVDEWQRIFFYLPREEDKGEEPSQEEIAMAIVVSQTSQKGNDGHQRQWWCTRKTVSCIDGRPCRWTLEDYH